MPLCSAASDAISIIISLRATSYFLQQNEGGEISNRTILFQSPWSAQLSSSQTPWAFNENCGKPNFLCCPWFPQPQIRSSTGGPVCHFHSLSPSLFCSYEFQHTYVFLWAFSQNWICSNIPFLCCKKYLRLLDIFLLDRPRSLHFLLFLLSFLFLNLPVFSFDQNTNLN